MKDYLGKDIWNFNDLALFLTYVAYLPISFLYDANDYTVKALQCLIIVFMFAVTSCNQHLAAQHSGIKTAAEQMGQYLPLLSNKNVAIVANQSSIIGNTHLVDTLVALGIHVKKIFSPEHGFRGNADAEITILEYSDLDTFKNAYLNRK